MDKFHDVMDMLRGVVKAQTLVDLADWLLATILIQDIKLESTCEAFIESHRSYSMGQGSSIGMLQHARLFLVDFERWLMDIEMVRGSTL